MSDYNAKLIEEFRANGGQVEGWEGEWKLLLLHHTGAKTGTERVSPLVYQQVGDSFAIFASKGGAPTNPDWYHNLMASPDTKIEVGVDAFAVSARELTGAERQEIWEHQKATLAQFAEYDAKTDRTIPVVLLERTG